MPFEKAQLNRRNSPENKYKNPFNEIRTGVYNNPAKGKQETLLEGIDARNGGNYYLRGTGPPDSSGGHTVPADPARFPVKDVDMRKSCLCGGGRHGSPSADCVAVILLSRLCFNTAGKILKLFLFSLLGIFQ